MLLGMNAGIRASLALLAASTVLASFSAAAQEVGAAAAVNPQSQGTPPGGATRVLQIGAQVVHNEQIQTTASGTVQILFLDKTTLNVGPNSQLVIDSFVYNPAAGTGQMVASLTKGALRFVGGELSHQGAATLKTPVATMGIRGGIATVAHGDNGTRAINNFGRLIVSNGAGSTTIRRAGFAVSVAGRTTPPTEPERVSQSETNYYLALLTSKPGQRGGAKSIPADRDISPYDIGTGTFGPDSQPIQQQTTSVENFVFDVIVQGAQKGIVRSVPGVPTRVTPTPPPFPCCVPF